MNRSSEYGFYLPQNTDPISVNDFNYNFDVIDDNMLSKNEQTLTSAQKSQVKSNLGFANQTDLDELDSKIDARTGYYTLLNKQTVTTSYQTYQTYNGRNLSDYTMLFITPDFGSWYVGSCAIPVSTFSSSGTNGVALFFHDGSNVIEVDVKYVSDTSFSIKYIGTTASSVHVSIYGIF